MAANETKKLLERLADFETRWDVDEIDPLTFHMKIEYIKTNYYRYLWSKLKELGKDELYAFIKDVDPTFLAEVSECIAQANIGLETAWAEVVRDGNKRGLEDRVYDRVWERHYRKEWEAIRRVQTVVYGVKYNIDFDRLTNVASISR